MTSRDGDLGCDNPTTHGCAPRIRWWPVERRKVELIQRLMERLDGRVVVVVKVVEGGEKMRAEEKLVKVFTGKVQERRGLRMTQTGQGRHAPAVKPDCAAIESRDEARGSLVLYGRDELDPTMQSACDREFIHMSMQIQWMLLKMARDNCSDRGHHPRARAISFTSTSASSSTGARVRLMRVIFYILLPHSFEEYCSFPLLEVR